MFVYELLPLHTNGIFIFLDTLGSNPIYRAIHIKDGNYMDNCNYTVKLIVLIL